MQGQFTNRPYVLFSSQRSGKQSSTGQLVHLILKQVGPPRSTEDHRFLLCRGGSRTAPTDIADSKPQRWQVRVFKMESLIEVASYLCGRCEDWASTLDKIESASIIISTILISI